MTLWDIAVAAFGKYMDAVCKEQLAFMSHESAKRIDPKSEHCRSKHAVWNLARQAKSDAYIAQVQAVARALESGIPCPW